MSDNALKTKLVNDLTASMKNQDKTRTATLRMVLAAISVEEVSGKKAHFLTDAQIVTVLNREAKKRREAAEAYTDAGRTAQADEELAELAIIEEYLPAGLSEKEVDQIVSRAVSSVGATSVQDMGVVMKLVQPQVSGRFDGKTVANKVRAALGG